MPSKLVHGQINEDLRVVRIFRDKSWRDFPSCEIVTVPRAEAVRMIREFVFARAKNPLTGQFECDKCGRTITWETGEMNEIVPKGKGGEVSTNNCEALCHDCHTGSPDSAHGDRRWQTAKLKEPHGHP